jgi:hypothetical protein
VERLYWNSLANLQSPSRRLAKNAKSASTRNKNQNGRRAQRFGPKPEKSRHTQNDWLCGEKINDGYDRASRKGTARPEYEAPPTRTPGGETSESPTCGDAASTFRWSKRSSLPVLPNIQADGSPPVPGPYRPANRSLRYQ